MTYKEFDRMLTGNDWGCRTMGRSPYQSDSYKSRLRWMSDAKRKSIIMEDEKLLRLLYAKYGNSPKAAELIRMLKDEMICCRRINAHNGRSETSTRRMDLYIDGYDPFCEYDDGRIEISHIICGVRVG